MLPTFPRISTVEFSFFQSSLARSLIQYITSPYYLYFPLPKIRQGSNDKHTQSHHALLQLISFSSFFFAYLRSRPPPKTRITAISSSSSSWPFQWFTMIVAQNAENALTVQNALKKPARCSLESLCQTPPRQPRHRLSSELDCPSSSSWLSSSSRL